MARAFIFGAGASFSYMQSKTGIRPPLATRLFETYFQLPIADDPYVVVGNLVNYVRDSRGIPPERFGDFKENAEDFLTELDDRVNELAWEIPALYERKNNQGARKFMEFIQANGAYDQSVWLFAHTLNETQNGSVSRQYSTLVNVLEKDDKLITFNWDTLLDRALMEYSNWTPDTGYGFEFNAIFDEGWRKVRDNESTRLLLKLHGSTNWLVNYITRDMRTGERAIVVPSTDKTTTGMSVSVSNQTRLDERDGLKVTYTPHIRTHPPVRSAPVPSGESSEVRPFCFVSGEKPFHCFKDRFRLGYDPFSYFYPPNHPNYPEVALMPLIIPPTRRKLYHEFGYIFSELWNLAEIALVSSNDWVIAGYSLPKTDLRTIELMQSALDQREQPVTVTLVNPSADEVQQRLIEALGPERLTFSPPFRDFDHYLESLTS